MIRVGKWWAEITGVVIRDIESHIESAYIEGRKQGLEEAAKECRAIADEAGFPGRDWANQCEDRIRALKEKA